MKSSAQPKAAPATTVVSPSRRPGQVLKLFAAAIFLAFVLPLVLLAGLLGWHQYRILTTWPAVDAVVTKAELITDTSHQQSAATSYSARFSFRYTAGGRVYDTSTDMGYKASLRSEVERWMAQMPAGSQQRIRYDPRNPANISLAGEYTSKSFAAPFALAEWAGGILVVCVILFWLGRRAGKKESGVSSQ